MIPKIIHYCWVGNAPKPKSVLYCIESWKKFCPDYEIREWNESNYDFTKNKYMKQAYEAKKWGFVPDYARLDIIYEYGGIYLDTDVEIIRSFDELLDQEAFMGFEETGEKTYYVNCGQGFGAVPHHEIIKKARDLYEHISFYKEDGTLNMLASPHYTTQILKEYGLLQENKDQNLRSMKIYASDVLCPKNFRTGKIHESNRTVSIHHFTASWLDEKIKKEIKRRQKLERVMGKGGTNKFLYIESVLQKYAGLKMFTKLPLRAKEKLKKRIIKIVEVVPDYKELILASFFKSDKKKIVLLDPSYDGDNTGDQIIVENCKKYFPLTKKENIIYVPTHRKLMNKEIRELSGATIKVLCGTNAFTGEGTIRYIYDGHQVGSATAKFTDKYLQKVSTGKERVDSKPKDVDNSGDSKKNGGKSSAKSIWKNFLQKVKAVWDFGQKKFAGKSSTEKYMIAGGCVALVILIFSLIVLLIRRRR